MKESRPILTECCKVPKGWGHEIVIVNNEKYCGKVLVFKRGFKFSMHYHIIKQETWYVSEGMFIFNWIDTEKGEKHTMELIQGDVVTIPIGMPHQLHALTDGAIFEISTQHFDSDSYRVYKGD
jgi:mannose-6-phosphate isomerase-like protein (cupin superfamily)